MIDLSHRRCVPLLLIAGLALAMYLSGDDLRRIVAWLLGSFANASLLGASKRKLRLKAGSPQQ